MKDFLSKIKVLDGASLKWIAMLSMLIDHINKGIINNLIIVKEYAPGWLLTISGIFEVLGRIAFPIFLFLLVEGFLHTRNRLHYFLYLLGFGLLAEIPYDMFESGVYIDHGGQNMYFTLALALLTLCLVEFLHRKLGKVWLLAAIPLTLVMGFLASALGLDYHYYGIFIPVVIYLFRDRLPVGLGLSYLIVIKELWSILGFAAIGLYNGKRGRINKWFCYLFYPVHLLIIGCIRMFIMHC